MAVECDQAWHPHVGAARLAAHAVGRRTAVHHADRSEGCQPSRAHPPRAPRPCAAHRCGPYELHTSRSGPSCSLDRPATGPAAPPLSSASTAQSAVQAEPGQAVFPVVEARYAKQLQRTTVSVQVPCERRCRAVLRRRSGRVACRESTPSGTRSSISDACTRRAVLTPTQLRSS
jgi:hypothetical protein